MADEQTVIVKVRAKRERGFIRGGIHWPATDTYQRVSEELAQQLEREPLLSVQRVSEADAPQGSVSPAGEKPAEQQRAEMVDQEFPQLTQAPGGAITGAGVPDRSEALLQGLREQPQQEQARVNVDPLQQRTLTEILAEQQAEGGTPVPDSAPPRVDEPESQATSFSIAQEPAATTTDPLTGETSEKKRRR